MNQEEQNKETKDLQRRRVTVIKKKVTLPNTENKQQPPKVKPLEEEPFEEEPSEVDASDADEKNHGTLTPSFLDTVFYKGFCIVLYGASGMLKSLISIIIGKSPTFKKCLYILINDNLQHDIDRYIKTLGDKAIIVTREDIQDKEVREKNDMETRIKLMDWYLCTYQDNIINKIIVSNKYTATIDELKKIDELTILEEIIKKVIKEDRVDFICLDSLIRLVDNPRSLNRGILERITKIARDNGVTLLCLHHENRKKEMAGPVFITKEFDYVYRLKSDDSNSNNQGNENVMVLTEEKANCSEPKKVRFRTIFSDSDIPKCEILEQNFYDGKASSGKKNLTTLIMEILDECDGKDLPYTAIKLMLGKKQKRLYTDKGIKVVLNSLEKEGKIKKTEYYASK